MTAEKRSAIALTDFLGAGFASSHSGASCLISAYKALGSIRQTLLVRSSAVQEASGVNLGMYLHV